MHEGADGWREDVHGVRGAAPDFRGAAVSEGEAGDLAGAVAVDLAADGEKSVESVASVPFAPFAGFSGARGGLDEGGAAHGAEFLTGHGTGGALSVCLVV